MPQFFNKFEIIKSKLIVLNLRGSLEKDLKISKSKSYFGNSYRTQNCYFNFLLLKAKFKIRALINVIKLMF